MNAESDKFSLLFVDDEKNILSTLNRTFLNEGYLLNEASGADDALTVLSKTKVHAALIDLKMPGMDGLSLLKKIKRNHPAVMVIMLTGHGNITHAVNAIQHGAEDFIEKPFFPESLISKVRHLFEIWQLKTENHKLKEEIRVKFKYEKLIGTSSKTLQLKKMIGMVSQSDATVLIQGETGTGKELVAKAIHHHSIRAKSPFVVVDCATINETMMDSELFGHEKGSFTGAFQSAKGLVQAAHGGTLFFDEIGELPLGIQAKLLRVLQEKEIRPVGSNKFQKVDIRIIAATNRNLKNEISHNRFREDLYYRLETVNISAPPLRERSEDIPLLIKYFIQMNTTDFSTIQDISKDALAHLIRYSWPGNVRELENVIRRVMALSRENKILLTDLSETISGPHLPVSLPSEDSMASYEKAAIKNALHKCNKHRKKAAKLLKIGEATLYRKLNKYWPENQL
ncbi:MAG: sigma-54-dependent Fis family transcriptional regulator [Gammaproteobacteria bacterium]|nr:sigma-54-dependent Fis family transcriptional regulator [Gammaproteobacteria bacterium]